MTPTPSSSSDGLIVEDLCRRFGPRWVLVRLFFNVPRGSALLLTGPNGSGKTTLLRCLAAALKPHQGGATFGGQHLWEDRHVARRDIALLSHATHLYDDLSASQNMAVWARLGGYELSAIPGLLERVGLADVGTRAVGLFSAGMKRRLTLARTLLKKPSLVLFDEPFSALDPEGRALVGEIITEIRQSGATMILSTHHHHLGAQYCDHLLSLEAGQIAYFGKMPQDFGGLSS